jgi:hypothetical protein
MIVETILVVAVLVGVSPLVVGVAAGTWRIVQMIRDPMAYVGWHY